MDVLVCLAEHAGEVVSRDTLNQRVWTHIVVTDQAVTNCISELRHHLGDDRSANRIIETIPKRGYRLVAPVRLAQAEPAEGDSRQALSRAPVRRRGLLAAGLLLLIVVVAGMDGALPSVVGGLVDCPVVAVPTSIGYGAAFGGLAPLLTMLNSCSAGVVVVNIDSGFKGGYVAALIARRAAGKRNE